MKDLKVGIDTKFVNEWVATPIQWDGLDFKSPTDKKWIGLKFTPIDRKAYAFDGSDGRTTDKALLEVSIYGSSSTESLSIGDDVKAFIENWNYTSIDAKVGLGVPDGHGVINLENDIFESVLTFQITRYN